MADESQFGEGRFRAEHAEPERKLEPAPPQKPRGPWLTIAGLALLALSKFKFLLIGLKALPFAKILLTSGTMLVSMAVYAWSMGIPFAVGFVLMILIHELGHGYAMRRHGLAAGAPVFIPFFGALISMKDQPRTPLVEAEIAIAGPVAGAASAIACCGLFFVTHSPLFLALAHAGFFLNLFNLTPFGFLDGGRVVKLFSRKMWILGALVLVGMFALTHSPQLLLIGLLSLPSLFGKSAPPPGDDQVTPSERLNMAFHYFGLCGFLAAGMYFSQRLLHPG
ncbi:MAG TPA: site-2 protease family protein [Polyangiaceae bacterium]|nr:site-2 protease family protein [Polyangiaceae bacterium]